MKTNPKSSPSANGANGSKSTRFKKGNPGGPGNPHAAITAKLRAELLNAYREGDIRDAIGVLVTIMLDTNARHADRIAATTVYLDRFLGKAQLPVAVTDTTDNVIRFDTLLERYRASNIPVSMWPPVLRMIEEESGTPDGMGIKKLF